MSNVTLFAVGLIVFIFLTWATLMFLYWRFNEIYRSDQDAIAASRPSMGDGIREPEPAPEAAEA